LQPVNFEQLYGQRMQEMAQQSGAESDAAEVAPGDAEVVDAEFPAEE
jgi:hypothetical protein